LTGSVSFITPRQRQEAATEKRKKKKKKFFSFISVYSQQKNENDKPPALQLSFLLFSLGPHTLH
jgi:hypothetical protein